MDESTGTRINKFIAESGYCSRREADRIIGLGRVTLDDQPVEPGTKVMPGQIVRIDGEPILKDDDLVYIALNKPIGIICTTDASRDDNIVRFVGHEKRIFPIGRLDRDSEGLILLTNDGNIVNKILRAANAHEKEYIVSVDRPISEEFLLGMASGVPILDTTTLPCRVTAEGPRTFRIILTQGLNRQIRRMCEHFGYEVLRLVRVRVMHITLGKLRPGEWRNLTAKEIAEINRLTRDSRQTSAG